MATRKPTNKTTGRRKTTGTKKSTSSAKRTGAKKTTSRSRAKKSTPASTSWLMAMERAFQAYEGALKTHASPEPGSEETPGLLPITEPTVIESQELAPLDAELLPSEPAPEPVLEQQTLETEATTSSTSEPAETTDSAPEDSISEPLNDPPAELLEEHEEQSSEDDEPEATTEALLEPEEHPAEPSPPAPSSPLGISTQTALNDQSAVNDNEVSEASTVGARLFSLGEVSTRSLELLQEDIQRLFQLGDINGALISLERLMIAGGGDKRLIPFIDRNEERLLTFFERIFDGFHQVVEQVHDVKPLGPQIKNVALLDSVWTAVGKGTDLKHILDKVPARPLETAALLHHLLRTHRLRFVDA